MTAADSPVVFPPGSTPRPVVDRAVIAALLGRALTDEEWARAQILLDLLWLEVLGRKPCEQAVVKPTWVTVLGELVADMLRNPGRYTSETEGDYSYARGKVAAVVGALGDDDMGRIWGGCPGMAADIFTIRTPPIRTWP
ncbi:hypothetical protein [Sciscionella sediminilitoris]|uniref:hypothetical protein n=1 Tax=Sciscionella sediminilitoris TaxID=1445613 RepID=UPI0004DF40CD|nr:hypothetical protein [Sciscionella sp. SE31]